MKDQLAFSDLRPGQKFVVLPGDGYNRRRDGDYLRKSYLFLKVAGPSGNAIRICDDLVCTIPDSVPVIRVEDGGKTARKGRERWPKNAE